MAKMTQSFNAEIKQLLDIVIHSLYSHKEIFIRELISNASDALDKLKFLSLTESNLVKPDHNYEIRLEADPNANLLKIIDSGIGMNPEEVAQFIGTIARSGTKNFTQMNQELKSRPELIGQFGVGFYSAFMVADKVTLHTQKAGTNIGTLWESKGDGSYTTEEVPRPGGTGTTITLYLKNPESQKEESASAPDLENQNYESQNFTDPWTIKSLVKKYSDFISWPIKMKKAGEEADETLNSQKALWLKSPSEIKDEEYKEFYQHISHDFNEPIKWTHFKAEGTLEFTSLFYFPKSKPWNYQMKDHEYGLNLYIKRVFIMDHCKDLIPAYLRFVKGMVDSSDLSLNVSRELLQKDKLVTQIRKNVVSKVLQSLKEMLTKDRSQYETFWSEFGPTLKEGIPMDTLNREKIQDLLLFQSTEGSQWTTLDEYVLRMKPNQKDIYYITGDRIEAIRNSPYLEKLQEKGFEVILMTDAVDEWVTQELTQFKDKKLVSITKSGLDLDTEEEKKQKENEKKGFQERFQPMIEKMKSALSTEVKDIVISERLTQTPVCLVSAEHEMSAHMQKILKQMNHEGIPENKRILEINPKHPIFETLLTADENRLKTWSEILFNQALLTEGSPIPDPVRFSRMLADLMIESGGKSQTQVKH